VARFPPGDIVLAAGLDPAATRVHLGRQASHCVMGLKRIPTAPEGVRGPKPARSTGRLRHQRQAPLRAATYGEPGKVPTSGDIALAAGLDPAATRVHLGRQASPCVMGLKRIPTAPEGVRGPKPARRARPASASATGAVEGRSVGGTWQGSPYESEEAEPCGPASREEGRGSFRS